MSLNALEKDILIKRFQEPRVHAAINCASRSCPGLLNAAYVASKLDAQLTGGFKSFVNDTLDGVTLFPGGKSVSISSIF